MSDDDNLDRSPPTVDVLELIGEINYAWAQLDLITSAAFGSLLNVDPVELGITIGRTETQAKINKMRAICRHRRNGELSDFFTNIKNELTRLRPTRNAVTHGAYMGKTGKDELCFRLPAEYIVAEGEETAHELFVSTIPELEQHSTDVLKLAVSVIKKFGMPEMRKLLHLPARVRSR